ncbi:MAG: histidine kinase, partial [Nonomuraea sp.]|nr:histidine kinase [Nonomuraea sp.]
MWNEARPPGSPVRVWRDWALVCALVPAAVLEGVLRPGLPWLSAAVTVVLVPTLLWRRSRPLLMLAICFAVTSVAPRPQPYALVFVLILVYAVARWGSGREVAAGFALTIAAIAVPAALHGMAASDVVGAFAVTVTALALGVAFRYRARARMRELDQVKLLEREQLARDLHDTVAHHVSAMAIRAQAGLARPDTALEALRVIEEEAGRTLEEMRGMVRILRTDGWESAGRGFADLAGLSGDGGGPA